MNASSKQVAPSRLPRLVIGVLLSLTIMAVACDDSSNDSDGLSLTLAVSGVPESATAVSASGDFGEDISLEQADELWQGTLTGLSQDQAYLVNLQATAGDSQSPVMVRSFTADEDSATIALDFVNSAEACMLAGITASAVQGSADASTLVDQAVTVIGVVTGDFQTENELSGFFLRDFLGDGNAASSDGLFVNVVSQENDVDVGDLVAISGTVSEEDDLTQLTNVTEVVVCSSDHTIPTTDVDLPTENVGDLEAFEGMLVSFDQDLTVSQNFFQGRYGQITLSADGRLYNPTNGNNLGESEDGNQRRLIFLDDGQDVDSRGDNPDPVPYLSEGNTLRVGDTVSNLTGILSYGQVSSSTSVRDYRLQPTVTPTFTRVNARQDAPDDVGGELKVASFNVLNYFTTFESDDDDARGAFNAGEFERQRDKIIAAIVAMDADIVGLIEIENNGGAGDTPTSSSTDQTAIDDLIAGLNEEMGAGTYAGFAAPDGLGDDAIKQTFIYKPATVSPVGDAILSTDDAYTVNGSSRRPVARTFEDNASSEQFTVIVNHFKSKGCRDAEGLDEDQGDGQGCYNATRTTQAQALVTLVDEIMAATGDDDVLVIGDLNAYGAEDPIVVLEQADFVDLIERDLPAEDRYSFIFSPGQSGYLDHALANTSLADNITGTTVWFINADEPAFLDYSTPPFKPDSVQALYTSTPFRSSDHDPVIVGLSFNN
ncbi:MAG: ExeM/NucH family extracellular endonuclease [Deinococcota bacterium]